MHIPDGFMSPAIWAPAYAISTTAVGISLKKARVSMEEKDIPTIGMAAAFIFAAQMLNFPIAGGTSGHFMGACLAVTLLGPWAATIAMACVLIVQCLIFQDGGLLALGTNILNMGVIGVWGSWLLCNGLGKYLKNKNISLFIGSWASIVLAALACSIELAVSGAVKPNVVIPVMTGIHALIGIGEGLITISVIGMINKVRPDILVEESVSR